MEKPFNLVEIQQVSKAYGSLVALNNINLKLEAGKSSAYLVQTDLEKQPLSSS